MLRKLGLAMLITLLTQTSSAYCQEAGSFSMTLGWFHFTPHDKSRPLTATFPTGVSLTAEGTGASVKDADTFGLAATYFLTDYIAAEAALGYPPRFRLNGSGSLSVLGEMGSALEWTPTVLLKMYFGPPRSKIRGFIGGGLAYAWYSAIRLSDDVANGRFLVFPQFFGKTTAELSKSFAPVVNIGFSAKIDKHWSFGASLSYMWLSTDAKLTTQSSFGPIVNRTRLRINPLISFIGLNYAF